MLYTVKNALALHGIDLVGAIPMSWCKIVRPHKLSAWREEDVSRLSVILFAIPYYTKQTRRNISAYAVSRDYHAFAKQVFDDVLPALRRHFPDYRFLGFADNSPISEVPAAAMAGLGIIGDNMMLITEKYSSFVFLAEIITDCPICPQGDRTIGVCEHCGSCRRACPMDRIGSCLSALTQKKGELTENEKAALIEYGSAWGCDICQNVCPHTKKAIANGTIYTPIEFFKQDTLPYLTSELVLSMSPQEFESRAFSWRGRNTILRNLEILENEEKGGEG